MSNRTCGTRSAVALFSFQASSDLLRRLLLAKKGFLFSFIHLQAVKRPLASSVAMSDSQQFLNDLDTKLDFAADRLHAKLEGDLNWHYGTPPRGNANFAWIQHMLQHLAPHGSMVARKKDDNFMKPYVRSKEIAILPKGGWAITAFTLCP